MDSPVPPIGHSSQVPPLIPPPIPIRKVTYQLDRRDVLGARLWVMAHNKFILGICIVGSIFWPLREMTEPSFSGTSLGFKIFLVAAGFAGFFVFMIVVQVLVQILFLFVRNNAGVVGTHEMEIRDDGLRQRTDVNESLHRWQGFHKIASTPGCIFVYTTQSNVEYIPRRAFASEHESRQFEQELITRSNNAKIRR